MMVDVCKTCPRKEECDAQDPFKGCLYTCGECKHKFSKTNKDGSYDCMAGGDFWPSRTVRADTRIPHWCLIFNPLTSLIEKDDE